MRRLLSRHSLIDGDHNERISSLSDAGWHQLLTGYFRFSFSTPGYHFNAAHRLYFPVSYPFLSFGSTRCGWANDHCRLPLCDGHHHVSPLGDVGIYAGIAAVWHLSLAKSVEYFAADGKPVDDFCVVSKTQRKITGIHIVRQPVLATEQCDCWLAGCRNHGTSIFRQYSGRLVASLRDQTLWMRINRRPARFAKTHQRQVTALGNFYRQRCRGRHSKQNLHAAHRRLLHHLVAGAAGD